MLRSAITLLALTASAVLVAASACYTVLVVGTRDEVHHHYGR